MSFSFPSGQQQRTVRSNYRVLGLIGQGQFGKVYCAVHRRSGKLVALKSLDRYRLSTQQFLRELRFLMSLRHRHIVSCQAIEHTRRGRYLVMDYCPGGTLRDLLEDEQCRINWSQGIQLIRDVLKGLAHAHAQNIIHCDIKPENILLDPTPHGWVARISDFGIAHVMQEEGSGDSGSPAYMAPERFYGQYHLSSDLYAVGIMLFELLVGDRPFTGTPIELRNAHLNQQPHIPDRIPPDLAQVLRQSLKKLPGQRFQSAQAMGEALEAAAQPLHSALTLADGSIVRDLADATDASDLRVPTDSPDAPVPVTGSPYFQKPEAFFSPTELPPPLATLKFPPDLKQLVIAPRQPEGLELYGVVDHKVFYQSRDSQSLLTRQNLDLGELPSHLVATATGVLVTTHQGLYGWFRSDGQGAKKFGQWQNRGDRILGLSPDQRWFMVGIPGSDHSLYLGSLRDPHRPKLLRKFAPTGRYDQAFLLDTTGHGILMTHREEGTGIQAFNRRAQKVGEWQVPLRLSSCQLGMKPYRLVALEAAAPHLVFLDLKPYRARRIYLPFHPQTFTLFPWGYVVSGEGALAVLDGEGRIIGAFQDGGVRPVKLQSLPDHRLVIQRETPQETIVQIWDMRDLDLEMIF